jgi:hypothetical protein
VNANSFTITVPALSTTAVLLKAANIVTDVTDVNTSDRKAVMIYPNPVKDKLHVKIDFTITEPTEIIVYNQIGQRLKSSTVTSGSQVVSTIDVSGFSPGFYFLSVKNSRYQKQLPFIISQ